MVVKMKYRKNLKYFCRNKNFGNKKYNEKYVAIISNGIEAK